MEKLQKVAYLIHVARGQDQINAVPFHLLYDRQEERHMRRVVDIDPDFLSLFSYPSSYRATVRFSPHGPRSSIPCILCHDTHRCFFRAIQTSYLPEIRVEQTRLCRHFLEE